jgi:phage gpG-like protein
MATVSIKGIKQLEAKLNRNLRIEVNKLFRDKELRDKIGVIVVKDIKDNYESKKPPADGTIKWREIYDPINRTDPAYDRSKIKAVFTGELLEDLRKNIKANTTDKQFVIEHSDKKHRKYQGKTKKIGSQSSYREISRGIIEGHGHNYMALTDEAKKEITNLVREKIFELVSRIK